MSSKNPTDRRTGTNIFSEGESLIFNWNKLNRLADQYGNSFYLLDMAKFAENFRKFKSEFCRIYRKTKIAYSYKTNYIPHICATVNNLGGYAEVVSTMEYELAMKIGVPPEKVIFNGPVKTRDDLTHILLNGGMVNLDSIYECEILQSIAEEYPKEKIAAGLRCNFSMPGSTRSHFGFDIENGELKKALECLASIKNFHVTGIHCHFSTGDRDIAGFSRRIKMMLTVVDKYFANHALQYIDIGGGFFGEIHTALKEQLQKKIPTFKEYAEAIASPMRRRFCGKSSPELILEPGIALIGDSVQFVSRVLGSKSINQQKIALVDGSIFNIKPTLHEKNMPMSVITAPGQNRAHLRFSETIDVVGSTCMERDVLFKGYPKEIHAGDFVVFEQVGGYTIVLTPPFIKSFPAILSRHHLRSSWVPIRRHGTFSDLFAGFNFDWKKHK